MKDSSALFHEVMDRITLKAESGEITTIASMLLEDVFNLTMTDVFTGKMIDVNPDAERLMEAYIARVNRHEPVQYVLGKAFFYGRPFNVDPSVLIPRPETEELVQAVLDWTKTVKSYEQVRSARFLDIGTGSGCIPITLSLEWPASEVFALDISREAIAVAKANARLHNTEIDFIMLDILKEDIPVGNFDAIVSNPPYIAECEKASILPAVLQFEPHLALFAPGDPLIFYRAIAVKAKSAMNSGGLLALEINEKFGGEVCAVLSDNGWAEVKLIRDISGKARIVTAIRR